MVAGFVCHPIVQILFLIDSGKKCNYVLGGLKNDSFPFWYFVGFYWCNAETLEME